MTLSRIDSGINERIRDVTGISHVFVHALSDTMPACDLRRGVIAASDIEWGDVCHVYCAQPSCSAAKDHIATHAEEFGRCAVVEYLSEGALAIEPSLLVDGTACHTAIQEWNAQKGRDTHPQLREA